MLNKVESMKSKQQELFKDKDIGFVKKRSRVNSLEGLVLSMNGSYTGRTPTPNSINETDMLLNNQKTRFITMNRALLAYSYANYGLVQTIIDVPVEDAMRSGITITGFAHITSEDFYDKEEKEEKRLTKILNSVKNIFNSKNPEQEKKLDDVKKEELDVDALIKLEKYEARKKIEKEAVNKQVSDEEKEKSIIGRELTDVEIKQIEDYILEHNVFEKIKQAIKWGRLYGGSGIIINNGQDFSKKLNINSINKDTPLEFIVADNWELAGVRTGSAMERDKTIWASETPFNYYGKTIHKSRVLTFMGKEAPSLVRQQMRGWGMSELERFVRSLNEYIKNNNVIYELLDEAKTNVYAFQGFNDSLQDQDGTNQIATRLQLAEKLKNYTNSIAIDSEDQYVQKQISFSGLADIAQQFRLNVAADLRMPVTKVFGMSAAGFNSGDDDIENYNNMIESEIRSKIRGIINKVLQVVARKVLGKDCTFEIEFAPLRTVSPVDKQKINNSKLQNIYKSYFIGFITAKEACKQINKENLLGFRIEEKDIISPDTELAKILVRDNL